MAGVLSARRALRTIGADAPADAVYRRIDFGWMRNGDPGAAVDGVEAGIGLPRRALGALLRADDPLLLGIGSPTHPLAAGVLVRLAAADRAIRELFVRRRGGSSFRPPVFPCVDRFPARRGSREPHIDWWENSVTATRAHKAFCLSLSEQFSGLHGRDLGHYRLRRAARLQGWGVRRRMGLSTARSFRPLRAAR